MKTEVESQFMRTVLGFTDSAKIHHFFTSDQMLKSDVGYLAAKSGDLKVAIQLVDRLTTSFNLSQLNVADNADCFLPIVAQEIWGDNAIPLAFATHLSLFYGVDLDLNCYQTNKAFHTGADPMERLISRANFDGIIESGKRYILVDDVSTMGSTLADCASFIAERGGIVNGAIVLANCSRSCKLKPRKQDVKLIKERFNDEIFNLFKINYAAVTFDEARYLAGFRGVNELRNRAIKAEYERKSRIASKNVSKSQSDL